MEARKSYSFILFNTVFIAFFAMFSYMLIGVDLQKVDKNCVIERCEGFSCQISARLQCRAEQEAQNRLDEIGLDI